MQTAIKLLTAIDPSWIATAIFALIALAAKKALSAVTDSHWAAQDQKLASDAINVAQQVLDGAVKASGGKVPTVADLPALEATAWAVLKPQLPTLLADSEDVAKLIISNHMKVAIGHPIVVAPGGASVALPAAVKVGVLVLACLVAGGARAQTTTVTVVPPSIDWRTVTINHGPSIPLLAIDPKNIHPLQLAAGAGYSIGACFGQLTLNGTPTSLLCASAVGFADVISPAGTPEGGVQVAFLAGFLGNALAVGPLLTPWTADGNGFIQAGRPGTDWVFSLNPVSVWHLLGGI